MPPLQNNNELQTVQKEITKIKEHMDFLQIDKTTHDLALCCRHLYQQTLNNQINGCNVYKEYNIEETKEEMIRLEKLNKKHGFRHTNNLPYLYGSPKFHKKPMKFRFIAGSSSKTNFDIQKEGDNCLFRGKPLTTTTEMSKELSGILKTLLFRIKTIEKEEERKTGIQKYFIVDNVDEVAKYIKANYTCLSYRNVKSFDFSDMYTNLPHKEILEEISTILNQYMSNDETLETNSTLQGMVSHFQITKMQRTDEPQPMESPRIKHLTPRTPEK